MKAKDWNKIILDLYPNFEIKLQARKENASVWKISDNGNNRIIRLYNTDLVNKEQIESEGYLLNKFHELLDYSGPKLLKKIFYSKKIKGFEISYINGRHPRVNSTKDFLACGKAIAKFHQITNQIEYDYFYQYNFENIATKTKGKLFRTYLDNQQKKKLTVILKRLERNLKPLESKNEFLGTLHGDPRWLNLIINESNTNLIDFGDCGYGLLIYDLAIGIADTVRNNPKNKIKIKTAMIDGYTSIFPNQKKIIEEKINDLICLRYIDTMVSPVTVWSEQKRKKYQNNIPRIINKCFILIDNL